MQADKPLPPDLKHGLRPELAEGPRPGRALFGAGGASTVEGVTGGAALGEQQSPSSVSEWFP